MGGFMVWLALCVAAIVAVSPVVLVALFVVKVFLRVGRWLFRRRVPQWVSSDD